MESELLQGYDPEFVAKRIAEAIVLGEKEVVIAPIHHRYCLVQYTMPLRHLELGYLESWGLFPTDYPSSTVVVSCETSDKLLVF